MGELGDALRLMHGAHGRFRTVRALIRERIDGRLAAKAEERFVASPQGRASGFHEDFDRRPDEGELRVREGLLRLWVEKPNRLREEREGELCGGPGTFVQDGRRWWRYHPGEGVDSNEDDPSVGARIGDRAHPLLDPAPLLSLLRFEPRGEVTLAGRSAIALAATQRPGDTMDDFALGQLGLGADAYTLAVDRERGVLLRAASLIDEEEFALMEMLEVSFDEEFPPETFMLTPPEGARVLPTWGTPPREVTIEEAARLASFPLWFPKTISPDWRITVGYLADDPASAETERVLIHLWRDDATHHVSISESGSGPPDLDDEWEAWTTVEREGVRLEVAEREHGPTRIRFAHEDTTIELTSDLQLETLLELAFAFGRV